MQNNCSINPYVSIIVPVHNAARWISKLLDQLLSVEDIPLQIILVENGSTDLSLQIIREYERENASITVLINHEKGVSRARNSGLKRASAPYILFLDADDYIEKDMIRRLVDAIEKENVGLSICDYIYEDENGNCISKNSLGRNQNFTTKELIDNIIRNNIIGGYPVNKLFKKSIIDNYCLKFDESLSVHEDLNFVLQYAFQIDKASYIAYCGYHYVFHSNSALSIRDLSHNYSRLRSYLLIDVMLNSRAEYSFKHEVVFFIYSYLSECIKNLCGNLEDDCFDYKECRANISYILKSYLMKILLNKNIPIISKLRIIVIRFIGINNWAKVRLLVHR